MDDNTYIYMYNYIFSNPRLCRYQARYSGYLLHVSKKWGLEYEVYGLDFLVWDFLVRGLLVWDQTYTFVCYELYIM